MGVNETVVFPDDYSALSREQLQTLQQDALTEFDLVASIEEIDDAGIERLEVLAAGIELVSAALTELDTQTITAANTVTYANELRNRVTRARSSTAAYRSDDNDSVTTDDTNTGNGSSASTAVAAVTASTRQNASLANATANAPTIPSQHNDGLVITASTATSGIQIDQRFDSNDALVAAMQSIARSLAPSHGNPSFQNVASIQNTFDHVVDGRGTKANELDAIIHDLLSRDNQEALVAGGGWCAPSERRYDFFNITCQDGMIDLPTIGVKRGGIEYPVSPSLADVYTGAFTNATNPWLWQEVDDEAIVTGGTVTKPCVRVICPTFEERRLECYGICLTAGNLTDYAYPEATRNHLSLLMSAHYHAMNARYINTMVSLSTAIGTIPASGTGILSDAPAVTALAAQDYRSYYGMCDNDILEAVFPRWVRDAMRIDHLRRNGFWASPLSDGDINRLFTANRVRVQWVNDWQIRGAGQPGNATPITSWPDTVQFMLYAAGTFVRGNGLTLDLGVVRDSVLNADNDHTAGWSEECHLIAMLGHASRLYTIPVCTAGRTGANDVVCSMTE